MQVVLTEMAYRALLLESADLEFAGVNKTENGYLIDISDSTYLEAKRLMNANESYSDFIIRLMGLEHERYSDSLDE